VRGEQLVESRQRLLCLGAGHPGDQNLVVSGTDACEPGRCPENGLQRLLGCPDLVLMLEPRANQGTRSAVRRRAPALLLEPGDQLFSTPTRRLATTRCLQDEKALSQRDGFPDMDGDLLTRSELPTPDARTVQALELFELEAVGSHPQQHV